ncbi:MAG: carboxymuconolactone decarboxylase family protein [Chloroflexota bacterium]
MVPATRDPGAFAGFGHSVYPGGLLERRVKELVIITASTTNACQFCANSHCDLVDIADIDDPLVVIDDTTTLSVRAARGGVRARGDARLNRGARSCLGAAPRAVWGPELVELSFLIGYINMLNLFNNLLGVRYHGEYGVLRRAG